VNHSSLSDADEDTLTHLLERYLHSNDPAVQRAVVEVLAEVLDAESDEQDAKRVSCSAPSL
jgi:hypothetical protein